MLLSYENKRVKHSFVAGKVIVAHLFPFANIAAMGSKPSRACCWRGRGLLFLEGATAAGRTSPLLLQEAHTVCSESWGW